MLAEMVWGLTGAFLVIIIFTSVRAAITKKFKKG